MSDILDDPHWRAWVGHRKVKDDDYGMDILHGPGEPIRGLSPDVGTKNTGVPKWPAVGAD